MAAEHPLGGRENIMNVQKAGNISMGQIESNALEYNVHLSLETRIIKIAYLRTAKERRGEGKEIEHM